MLTVAVVSWVIGLSIAFLVIYRYLESLENIYETLNFTGDPLATSLFLFTFISTIIGFAIAVDLAVREGVSFDLVLLEFSGDVSGFNERVAMISGLVALGIASVAGIVTWHFSDAGRVETDMKGCNPRITLIVEVVALIASILGILSFYLDYLQPG